MAYKPYNVAIIGYGMSAKVFHIPLITALPTFHLHSIVQRHPTPDNDAQQDHPSVKTYTISKKMLENSAIDLVVITTIPDTHYELCRLALEHNKHVVVEKPFTPTSREVGELIKLAEIKNRLLTVYQNRRWDTDFLTLTSLLESDKLGRVAEFETHFDRHRPIAPEANLTWKARRMPGGGAAYDLGVHLIDQVVVLFGLPDKITGFVGSQREGNPEGVEDSCTILLHYTSKALLATVKIGVISAEIKQRRFWVRGTKGTYTKYHLDPQEDQLKQGCRPGDPDFGVEPEERAGRLTLLDTEGNPQREVCPNVEPATYSAFYIQLAKALAGEGDLPIKAEDARDIIRLIELARLSSEEERTLQIADVYPDID